MAAAVDGLEVDLAAWLRSAGPYPAVPGAPPPIRCGAHVLSFGIKTYVVAILNRTPDSFSEERPDVPTVEELVARAWAAYRAGADIVDIGAESSEERDRRGLPAEKEAERLLPVLEALTDLPVILSIDTRRGSVARAALRLGPAIINDVSAGADPELLAAAANAGVPMVLMHAGGIAPGTDLMTTLTARLGLALSRAVARGLPTEQAILDAGFGFGTTIDQDLEVTRRLGKLRGLGRPLMHAPSRKRTIGGVLAFPDSIPERLPGTAALVAAGIGAGADLIRVHDVAAMARVARMSDAVWRGQGWRAVVAP